MSRAACPPGCSPSVIWRPGPATGSPAAGGALRRGFANGLGCVGCCFGLMAVLFALGVMSLLWMAVVAGVIFAEKVLPHGLRLSRAVAVALVALGLWVAVSPPSVPGLTEPGRAASMAQPEHPST